MSNTYGSIRPLRYIYSPPGDTAVVSVGEGETLWANFQTGVVKSSFTGDSPKVPLANGDYISEQEDYTGTVRQLLLHSSTVYPLLRAKNKIIPNTGKVGNSITEGVHEVDTTEFNLPFYREDKRFTITNSSQLSDGVYVLDWVLINELDPNYSVVFIKPVNGIIGTTYEHYYLLPDNTNQQLFIAGNLGLTTGVAAYNLNTVVNLDTGAVTSTSGVSVTVGGSLYGRQVASVMSAGKVYLIGTGSTNTKTTSHVYDVATGVMSGIANPVTMSHLNLPMLSSSDPTSTQGGAFVYGGTVYVMYGGNLYSYNDVGNTWSTVSTSPADSNLYPKTPMMIHGTQVAWVLDGFSMSQNDHRVVVYDFSGNSWNAFTAQATYPLYSFSDVGNPFDIGNGVYMIGAHNYFAFSGATVPF